MTNRAWFGTTGRARSSKAVSKDLTPSSTWPVWASAINGGMQSERNKFGPVEPCRPRILFVFLPRLNNHPRPSCAALRWASTAIAAMNRSLNPRRQAMISFLKCVKRGKPLVLRLKTSGYAPFGCELDSSPRPWAGRWNNSCFRPFSAPGDRREEAGNITHGFHSTTTSTPPII